MAIPYVAGQAALWLQPTGPNTRPLYLGCHEVSDIDEPQGDVTLFQIADPAGVNGFSVIGSVQAGSGPPTATITTDVTETADYLESLRCPATLFVHKMACGRRDLFTNYDRSFIMSNMRITAKGLAGLSVRTDADNTRSTQTFNVTAERLYRILPLQADEQATIIRGFSLIAFLDNPGCLCPSGPCDDGVAVGLADVTAKSIMRTTHDGGETWTAVAADPFAINENIGAVVLIPMSPAVTRILAGRGTADGANPAEVAWSDDWGATWTLVNVGGINGQVIYAMWALDKFHTWCTADDYVYFSDDAGETWTAQEQGVLSPGNDYYGVKFVNQNDGYATGEANSIIYTANGGATWLSLTGPAAEAGNDIVALEAIDRYRVWLGYNGGHLWYTNDGGVTWMQRQRPAARVFVFGLRFINPLIGYLSDIGGGNGYLSRTIDGGFTWQDVDIRSNEILLGLHVCGINEAYVAGVNGVTGYGSVYKLEER